MDNVFDVIVLGTGLSESIVAAAFAKSGLRVAHIDPNPYYGAAEATLTLDELVRWAETHSTDPIGDRGRIHYRIDYLSPNCPSHQKQYSISLSPTVIPSSGPFISSLIASGVAHYGSYKLLGPAAIYHDGVFQSVPQNKEAIFKDRSISLIEKRRLMRFLLFASGEFEKSPEIRGNEDTPFGRFLCESFSLGEDISDVIMFSFAYCHFAGDSTLTALRRVRSCLRSAGRYGSSPFLVGYYGGSGEITQGFCRAAAVNGGVYILGRSISNLVHNSRDPERFSVELEDISEDLRTSCILSSLDCIPRDLRSQVNLIPSDSDGHSTSRSWVQAVARCIAIVDGTVTPPSLFETDDAPVEGQSDSYLFVFPPGSLAGGSLTSSVTLLTAGPGTMSAPLKKNIIYLFMPLSGHNKPSKELLQPYLDKILYLNPTCQLTFELFYMQYFPILHQQPKDIIPNIFTLPHLEPDIFQTVDQAANDAKIAFQSIMQVVGLQKNVNKVIDFWTDHSMIDING